MPRMSYAGLAGARDFSRELHTEAARAKTVKRLRRESVFQLARVNEPGLYQATPKDEDNDSYLLRLGFIDEDAPPLLNISVVGHEEETLHGEGALTCTLYEIHCSLSPVGVTPTAGDELSMRLTTQWRCKRRLCDIRSDLHDKFKKKIGAAYMNWFRNTPFARRGGIKGTTGRLRAWFMTFADYFNTVTTDKKTKEKWLRFLGAPGKPRRSRAGSASTSGHTSLASSARPSLTSRSSILMARGHSPYGSRQISRQNSKALSRSSSSTSLSTYEKDKSTQVSWRPIGFSAATTAQSAAMSSTGHASSSGYSSSSAYPMGAGTQQSSASSASSGHASPLSQRSPGPLAAAGLHADQIMHALASMDLNRTNDVRASPSRLPELKEESEDIQDFFEGEYQSYEIPQYYDGEVVAEDEACYDETQPIESDVLREEDNCGPAPVRVLL
eukprot:TRINITY_DN75128_c0_g1_i1.p1 TRINITY_DN75128_c0_g1~~TRINITY_DN75128_c0_g1_i1.p1  ORF type:complete len:442 (+),score=55.84 TRINITY_DN75128_c0_g1_i1:63-1388(+)